MFIQLLLLLAVALFIFLIYKLIKNAFLLAINSIIGIFALYGFNILFSAGIKIGFWSVIIVAVGGIFGFLGVMIFHYLGLGF